MKCSRSDVKVVAISLNLFHQVLKHLIPNPKGAAITGRTCNHPR